VANGVQLATAYISLNVRTDGVKQQIEKAVNSAGPVGKRAGNAMGTGMLSGLRARMAGSSTIMSNVLNPMQIAGVRWAVAAGAKIGGALRTAIVAGLTAGIGAAIFGAGAALTAGLARLQTLQQSRIQLSLRLNPQEITNLQKQVAEVVTGTNVMLDEAMAAVPKAINSGLSVDEVKQYVKDLADAAAATGGIADVGTLDQILTQVRTNRALLTDEINQLTTAGLDIRGALREAFGYDDKTLDKNLKNKAIGIEEVQEAIQKVYGEVDAGNGKQGLAQLLGTKTLDGSIKAAKASISRIGAEFISAIVGKEASEDPLNEYAMLINKVTEGLVGIEEWIRDNRGTINDYFMNAKDGAVGLANGVKSAVEWVRKLWASAQDLGSRLANAFDKATSAVSRMWNKVKEVFGDIKQSITNIVDDVKNKFTSIFGENGFFAQQFKNLGDMIGGVRDTLGLGMPQAQASTPQASPGGGAPFNPGPRRATPAPGGRLEPTLDMSGSLAGVNAGAMIGVDQTASSGLQARMPSKSVVGAPIYGGGPTQDTGGSVEPRNAMVQDLIQQKFGGDGAWIGNDYRKPDGFNEHSSGQAADIMISELGQRTEEGIALGNRINQWLIANAKKIGLQYTIWDGKLYRPDGSVSPNPGAGITGNHEDHVHYRVNPGAIDELPQFNAGGKVMGSGSSTSDSIPALLSNGEHVLTAEDVKRMGGQQGVYAFRAALQNGLMPGFNDGGAVDPQTIIDAQNNVADLTKQAEIARERQRELPQDSSESERMRAQIQANQARVAAEAAAADLPMILSGMTPPDRPEITQMQLDDNLRMAEQALKDANEQDDVPYSRRLQLNNDIVKAQRDRAEFAKQQEQSGDYGGNFLRSLGFMPQNAGNTNVAGTSALSGYINMGNEVVGGIIDTGASLAQMAVQAGLAGATFGGSALAGPAAGQAAGYGIQLAASTAKRLSSYGFQLLGIGADALVEQLFPFGAPRAIGYDTTQFMPQIGFQAAALGTLEQMGQDFIRNRMGQQVNTQGPPPTPAPVTDQLYGANDPRFVTPPAPPAPQPFVTDQGLLQPGDPGFFAKPVDDLAMFPGGGGGSWAKGGHVGVFDQGGILEPNSLAFNASRTPEKVLTQQQWDAMAQLMPAGRDAPLVENLYAQDMQDAIRQLEKTKRRDMMQYAGRP
jgi:hypothetical protein